MKKLLIILTLALTFSCGSRKAVVNTEKVQLFEVVKKERTAPGDIVEVVLPSKLQDRPKEQQKVYLGEQGAKSVINFNTEGIVTSVLTICPEVKELEETVLDLQAKIKQKESERSAPGWQYFLLGLATGALFAAGYHLSRKKT